MTIKTFRDFQQTRYWSSDVGQTLGIDAGGHPDMKSGYIYADSYYIMAGGENTKAYWLIIGNAEYESDELEILEHRLWRDLARQELTGRESYAPVAPQSVTVWHTLYNDLVTGSPLEIILSNGDAVRVYEREDGANHLARVEYVNNAHPNVPQYCGGSK
jgi:hypothetical protein